MPNTPLLWVTLSALFLCFVLIVVLWFYVQNVKAKLMQSIGLLDDLYQLTSAQAKIMDTVKVEQLDMIKCQKAQQKQYEILSSDVEERVRKMEDTVERLEEHDPALKMYSRASKLVEQGAAMEDIIEASGLPRAEVEVLISLHAKK